MFWDEEITPEDEAQVIEWVARELYKYGLETAGLLFIESLKPLSRVGSSMGQMLFMPMMPIFGDGAVVKSNKVFRVFEETRNVERLLDRLEELATHGLDPEKKKEANNIEEKPAEKVKREKKGWRKFLPF